MSVLDAGPMTPDKLKAGSSSTAFGGGEIDNISLFPLPAAPGSAPVADWSWVSLWQGYFSDIGELLPSSPSVIPVSDPHFYNYQLETYLGQHGPTNRTITAPMYVRIAMRDDYYLISYFGFFAYNGGLGPQTSYASRPLGSGSGFGAHIGDWIRLTAKVKINQDKVSLLYVDYEAHGDPNIVTSSNFSDLTLDQVPRLNGYAAWHSHELYTTAGVHMRTETGFTANDYTDDVGPVWDTAPNLTFISDDGPAWVFYNGLWGANITVSGFIQNYLKNGPQGPAFHWYWTSETKDGQSPIVQWRDNQAPQLPPTTGVNWSLSPGTYVYPRTPITASWAAVPQATSYVLNLYRNDACILTTTVSGTQFTYNITGPDMYFSLTLEVIAMGLNTQPGVPCRSSSFYCGNSTG
ncbi:hypothetical protein [Brevundimonas aurantiaca]|uniref:hypothetical protein n=1 Tax=Brevundimonas aurantiaca TaxID=74316 RepID=UPI001918327F|nr:hypothetical protein [Brevundimonas aurantiaca]